MKKITFTKTTDFDIDGDVRSVYFVVKVDGIKIGTVSKESGFGRYGRETKWVSGENYNINYDTRKELVAELICCHFNLIPADWVRGGIEATVAEFLAA